jgi:hypothetical protein
VALGGEHPAQEKQIARLHRFHICPEQLRPQRELDAKFFQALLGAGWRGAFAGYYLATCPASPWCLQQLFQLLERFGILRADWGVVAAGIRSLQSTSHRACNRERSATVAGFAHEVPLRSSWDVTAETVSAKSIHDIDGPSFANLRSILRYVELKELPIMHCAVEALIPLDQASPGIN